MKVKVLNQTHPSYNGPRLARCRALYEGGDAWHAQIATWLPQHAQEPAKLWALRKKAALYLNHTGPIVDILGAAVFTEAPTITDYDGAWVDAFVQNVDQAGTPLAAWFCERLKDALVERTTYAWVNLPAREEGVEYETLGQEEQAGALDAYVVKFTAEQVIDWKLDSKGALQWIVVRDKVEEREGIDAEYACQWRWTFIDATLIRRWIWTPKTGKSQPKDSDETTELPPIAHNLGELPVVRLSLTEGLWALGKLHDPAIAQLRARNGLSWALDRAAHALLAIKSKWGDEDPVLGPGTFLRLENEHDEAYYVEPSGANFALLAEDVKALREDLYKVVHQMSIGSSETATKSKQSGESKNADWRALEIVLSALAETARGFMRDVLRLVAKAHGVQDAKPVVTGLDGWQEEDLEVWLNAASLAVDAHRLSPTFTKTVAKRQAAKVLQGSDPKVLAEIEGEIDASDPDPAAYLPTPPMAPLDPEDDEEADPELEPKPEPEPKTKGRPAPKTKGRIRAASK